MIKLPFTPNDKFKQIVRFDPAADIDALKRTMDCSELIGGTVFDLRGYAAPPIELINRTNRETYGTSSKARMESKRLMEKYYVDNVEDWYRDNWFGITINIEAAEWIDSHTLVITSQEDMFPVIRGIAHQNKVDVYFSYVNVTDFIEEHCGFKKISGVGETYELGNVKYELFAFASILEAGKPLSFETWEEENVNEPNYYVSHFLEDDAESLIKAAFENNNKICLANLMVNTILSPERIWNGISKFF